MTDSTDPIESPFEELLLEALDQLEAEGSAGFEAFCDRHPGEAAELRKRVELLRAAGLLGGTVGETGAAQGEAAPDFPERLGDFRLEERLGAGGMGVVYRAEQVSLGRTVALKLIRPEQLYFPGARARFAREVEAASRLAHPAIAAVHLVGEEGGVPFFAMELVEGLSLDRILRELRAKPPEDLGGSHLAEILGAERDLPPFDLGWKEACLWIAREIAQALEHAHQRGVLHRDVKPSNIMLTPAGRVLLLDFGLASTEGATRLTRTGSQLGSLAYMAPEQVQGDTETIGVRTDIYCLGATLYELLSRHLPYEEERSDQLMRRILEGRPTPLRAHLSGAPKDLEAVVQTAMASEASGRYPSAADLAQDLTRLLEHRPVEARASGPWLQLVRWVQRNRGAAAAAGLALFASIAVPLLFGLQQLRMNERVEEQRRIAQKNFEDAVTAGERLEEQRQIAQDNYEEAVRAGERLEVQRKKAERNLEKALEAVDVMLTQVAVEDLADIPQLERVRRELFETARNFLGELDDLAEGSTDVRRRRGRVALSLADLDALLGNRGSAEESFRESIATFDELLAGPDAQSIDREMQARAYAGAAEVMLLDGRIDEALELLDQGMEALTLAAQAGYEAPWTQVMLIHDLGNALLSAGRTEEALETMREGIALGEEVLASGRGDGSMRARMVALRNELGRVLLNRAPVQAVPVLAEAFAAARERLNEAPENALARLNLGEVAINYSEVLSRTGQNAASLPVAEEGVAVLAALVRDFPTVRHYRVTLSVLRVNLAVQLSSLEQREKSLEVLADATEVLRTLIRDDPSNVQHAHRIGAALCNRAAILQELGQAEESEAPLLEALDHHRRAVAAAPDNPAYRYHLGIALINTGNLALTRGDHASAVPWLDECLPHLKADPRAQHFVATQWMVAADLAGEEDPEQAELYFNAAVATLEGAIRSGWRGNLAQEEVWEPLRGGEDFEGLVRAAAGD